MRKLNGGTIYQRASDNLWCAAIALPPLDGKRRKKVVTSKDRSVVEAKLLEMNPNVRPVSQRTRAENMELARAVATHERHEWTAKVSSMSDKCRYCRVKMNLWNMVKDHMIAIERGGSDGIDNVQPICWECNMEKRTTPHNEFKYTGPKPRPFSVMPFKLDEYTHFQKFRAAGLGLWANRK